jgi:hypothetical protein
MDSETRRLIKAAVDQGWRVRETGKNYLLFWPPDRKRSCVIRAKTPSDHRAERNFLQEMRKRGFIWPSGKQEGKKSKRSG